VGFSASSDLQFHPPLRREEEPPVAVLEARDNPFPSSSSSSASSATATALLTRRTMVVKLEEVGVGERREVGERKDAVREGERVTEGEREPETV